MANVTLAQTAVDSLNTDSVRPLIQVKLIEGLNYLDSLKKDNNLRKMFFLNEQVSGEAVQMNGSEKPRDLPRLKSIRYRLPRKENWKFWILV